VREPCANSVNQDTSHTN